MSNYCTVDDAVILAGGQGQRLGGIQKALIEVEGQAIISHVLQCLKPQVDRVWVNANQSLEAYEVFGCPVIEDRQKGFLGPLEGLATAIETIGCEWLLFLPCDNPAISSDLLNRLIETHQKQPAPLVVASDGDRIQPLYGIIHRSLLIHLRETIAKQHLSVMRWMTEVPHAIADFSDQKSSFRNLNEAKDFE